MSNKKQTAVDWLEDQIRWEISNSNKLEPLIAKAKELEKQQIIDFGNNLLDANVSSFDKDIDWAEQFYYETYER